MANIYDHVNITINIRSDYSSDTISFTYAQCLLKEKGFCEENLVQETKQPGMLKNASGIFKKKNVSNALSNVLIHRSNTHTDRILRDSLSPGLNNQQTIPITTILQCSENHYERDET